MYHFHRPLISLGWLNSISCFLFDFFWMIFVFLTHKCWLLHILFCLSFHIWTIVFFFCFAFIFVCECNMCRVHVTFLDIGRLLIVCYAIMCDVSCLYKYLGQEMYLFFVVNCHGKWMEKKINLFRWWTLKVSEWKWKYRLTQTRSYFERNSNV